MESSYSMIFMRSEGFKVKIDDKQTKVIITGKDSPLPDEWEKPIAEGTLGKFLGLESLELPEGWGLIGYHPSGYRIAILPKVEDESEVLRDVEEVVPIGTWRLISLNKRAV